MADDEKIFGVEVGLEEFLEFLEGGGGGEGVRDEDGGLVAGLGADEGGGLEGAFEGARDDDVELYLHSVQHMRELQTMTLAVFVEGTFEVEEGIEAAYASAGVAEDVKVHGQIRCYRTMNQRWNAWCEGGKNWTLGTG